MPKKKPRRPRNSRLVKLAGSICAFVAAAALLGANLNQITAIVQGWFTRQQTIEPFSGGADFLRPPSVKGDSPLSVETIQVPKAHGNHEHLFYDVFIRNPSKEDILLTKIWYHSRMELPHGDGSTTGGVEPVITYELEYRSSLVDGHPTSGELALSPPFELKSGQLRGIRLYFRPAESKRGDRDEFTVPHLFDFDIIDSKGRRLPVVRETNN